ncbi:uncharacterized protein LOC116140629 [Pistacia vera]|uniref:uncharacterized protein LOC116140629 n=1 Tax=Pistacia vera TaxID=55513 RepID=UPI001263D161|nr:uncharacterized protein LOC116140629 [Pistacia vera]
MEELDEVQIHPDDPERKTHIGSRLKPETREKLTEFLKQNQDCFAWSHADMTGVRQEAMVHQLKVDPDHPPMKQKRRKFASERNQIVNEEVEELLSNVELSEFDISYQSRTAIKSQALADFIVDFTPNTTTQAESELLCMNGGSPSKWTLLVDGLSNVNGSGLGVVLITPEGDIIPRAIRCGFKCANNEAEYEALIAGLSLAKEIGEKKLGVKSDSQLVVNQLQDTYQICDSKMTSYLSMVKELQAQFDEFSIVQIPKAENSHANALANLGSALKCSSQSSIPLLFMQWPANWKGRQPNKSPEEAMGVELADCWMTLIVRYLTRRTPS